MFRQANIGYLIIMWHLCFPRVAQYLTGMFFDATTVEVSAGNDDEKVAIALLDDSKGWFDFAML